MRDTQRQRVYDAERMVPRSPIGTGSIDETVEFTAKVVGSTWWRKRSGVRRVHVGDGRGRVNACAYGTTIKIPRWGRSKMVVLHELAHILNTRGAPHGREFAACFIALVDRFGEPEAGKQLREAFKTKRVRWRGAAPEVVRQATSYCTQCKKGFPKPPPWRIGKTDREWFCTKRCASVWFQNRLHRVEAAAAIRDY